MIVDFFLYLIYQVSMWFLSLLPDISFNDSVSSAVTTASSYLSAMSGFAPVTTLLAIVGLFLTIEGVILIIKITNWFIRKIPTVD